MHFDLLQVSTPGLAYIILGGFVVAFTMLHLLLTEKLFVNEVIVGTTFGIIMGPYCANIFDPRSWSANTSRITLEVMRVVLVIGLFAVGVGLPKSYMAKHAKGLAIMVMPTMAFGWVVVAGIIYAIFPSLSYVSALAIAACLTPTDPIICAVIIGGKFALEHVPDNVRYILSAESASNDGLAYPFLSIAIYLTMESSREVAVAKWFLVGLLYQVILGTVLGAILGLVFGKLLRFLRHKKLISRESLVAQYLGVAIFTTGVTSTIGCDDLLAAFAAGCAIAWDGYFKEETEHMIFSSVIDLVLNCSCFVYIGAWLPFEASNSPETGITVTRLVILLLCITVVRRIPVLLALYRWVPEIKSWKEALVAGHFGPMGVSAIFVSTMAVTRLPQPHNPPQSQQELLAATLPTVVAFMVLGSIIIHGLSVSSYSLGYWIRTRIMYRTENDLSDMATITVDCSGKDDFSADPELGLQDQVAVLNKQTPEDDHTNVQGMSTDSKAV